jgi:hypothetical protein
VNIVVLRHHTAEHQPQLAIYSLVGVPQLPNRYQNRKEGGYCGDERECVCGAEPPVASLLELVTTSG